MYYIISSDLGVNQGGLMPNHIWQMDVTHYAEFGKLKYIHVCIDTCSGFLFASLHTGEASKNVIDHCLQAFNAMGLPKLIKTDNGPSYSSKNFTSFFKSAMGTFNYSLSHGVIRNSSFMFDAKFFTK